MNGKERLDRFLAGEEVDRRPNLTIVGSFVTEYTHITLEDYCKNPEKMVQSSIRCTHDVGLDMVQVASDLFREAEAYGSHIVYYDSRMPELYKPRLDDIEKVEELEPVHLADSQRLQDIVYATKRAIELSDDCYSMTMLAGPATVAGCIRGIMDFTADTLEFPEECKTLLEMVGETTIEVVDALAAVGAKYVYLADPVASVSLQQSYRDLILPVQQRIFKHMEDLGLVGRLHMCGSAMGMLPYSVGSGAKILDIDHYVDYAEALKIADGRVILNGNIDPVADVNQKTAPDVYREIFELAENLGNPHALFMPGCELPTKTDVRCVRAIGQALANLGPA